MKIAPEGYPFIITCAALAALMAILTIFMLYFFRDPERNVPKRDDVFVSPADGRVLLVRDAEESVYCKGPRTQISIFMSPFDVHVNRSPCAGVVREVQRHHGKYVAAYRDEASLQNENTEMAIESKWGVVLVRQVAGYIARRTVCRAKIGDRLGLGDRFGIIKFSSRVDLYLPRECRVAIKPGDRVLAGETILAEISPKA